jgi:peroxiredoxin
MPTDLFRHVSIVILAVASLALPGVRAEIYPDAEAAQPLMAGEMAPDFVAWHPDGSEYRFVAAERGGPTLLIFYRGGWCPYCNLHLGQLGAVEGELKELGYELLFLSADRPERIFAQLEEDNREIGYTLLSDQGLKVTEAFGLAYWVSDDYQRRLMEMGYDLTEETGLERPVLPVPAAYIVGTDGVIRYVYANPDYHVRVDLDELMAVAARYAEP